MEKRAIERTVLHPKFSYDKYDYDVGVVKVKTPFVESATQKRIALVKAGEDPAAGEQVVVSGWGWNEVCFNSSLSI